MAKRIQSVIGWGAILGGIIGLCTLFIPLATAYWQLISAPLPVFSDSESVDVSSAPETIRQGWYLRIESLGLELPIVLDVNSGSQKEYNQALKEGVAHMKGSAPLDGISGNSVIFGHSSRIPPTGTPNDTAFATLGTLKIGDDINIVQNGIATPYKIYRSELIDPNNTTVLDQTDTKTITLLTCWPPGTVINRWVIQAKSL